jgi:hypothetical protein
MKFASADFIRISNMISGSFEREKAHGLRDPGKPGPTKQKALDKNNIMS